MDPLLLTIVLVLIPVVYALGFSGCEPYQGGAPAPDPAPSPTPTPTPSPNPTPPDPKYEEVILAEPGLVSYWRLGESSGTVAKDSAPGGSRDGEYKEPLTISLGEPGALVARDPNDKAPRFQGTAGRVDVPYDMLLNPPVSFSLEMWIKPDSSNPGNRAAVAAGLFTVDSNVLVTKGFALSVLYPALEIKAEIGLEKVVPTATLPAGYPPRLTLGNDGAWKHIVFTLNVTPAAIELKLHFNGSAAQVVSIDRSQFSYKNDLTATPFRIGAGWALQVPTPVPLFFFNGRIDEVAFYNKALDATAVRRHYQASLPKA